MNYEDFLPLNLNISTLGRTYGKDNQIKIIGWSGLSSKTRKVIVHCTTCEKDPELFGEGVFTTYSGNLSKGHYPCGCGSWNIWTEDQWKIRAKRKAKELGFHFIDWFGNYHNSKSMAVMLCCKHGLWNTTKVQAMIHLGHGCPRCSAEKSSVRLTTTEENKASVLLATGLFHPQTKFKKLGSVTDWEVTCGDCEEIYVRSQINLKYKGPSCSCSGKERLVQKYSYINLVSDSSTPIAVKFGITNDPKNRVKQQASKSVYKIENLFVYEYDSPNECRLAENICKSELQTRVVNSTEMLDGYTETTYISNIDTIIKIYESCGGRRVSVC